MTLRVRVTPEALADLDEAQDWYEANRRGLGLEFLEAVEQALGLAAEWPDAARHVGGATLRVFVPRFPYGLFYAIENDELVLLGCVHVRRHPRVWRRRLRRPPEA